MEQEEPSRESPVATEEAKEESPTTVEETSQPEDDRQIEGNDSKDDEGKDGGTEEEVSPPPPEEEKELIEETIEPTGPVESVETEEEQKEEEEEVKPDSTGTEEKTEEEEEEAECEQQVYEEENKEEEQEGEQTKVDDADEVQTTNGVQDEVVNESPAEESLPTKKSPPVPVANGTVGEEIHSYMSTSAEVADADALRQAIAEIRSDASGVNRKSWLVVGHVNNNPNLVDIVGKDVSESANLADMMDILQDDQVMYALVRLTTTVDMSATVRFVYVHWVGDQVPFAKRGRYGVVHGSIETYFNPYHVMLETGNPDELSEEEIVKLLEEKSMTANRIVATPTDTRLLRGFTQHQVTRSGSTQTPKAVAPSGNTVEVSPEIQETIGEIRQDSSPVTWLLAGYGENNAKNPLTLVAKGSGDIEELKAELKSDHVMYGLLRTSDVYDDIKTVKFVYIYWVGEEVKPMMKGKVYANAGSVESIFSPMHVTLSISNVDELTADVITDKVAASSGSKSFVMK